MERGEVRVAQVLRGRKHFSLHYEEIAQRSEELFEWLGMDASGFTYSGPGIRKKQNTGQVLNRFSNPELVKRLLAGTTWESYLE